jgi:hypothetical protein
MTWGPADDRSNSQILSEALGRHDEVRLAARVVLERIRSIEQDSEGAAGALREAVAELEDVIHRVNAEEGLSLVPALRCRDAWGERRVGELYAQHDEVAAARAPLSSASVDELVREARAFVRAVVRALRTEESTVLSAELWSDDIVNLDPD